MTIPAITGTLESALYARDLERSEAFYAGTLGLPVVTRQAGRHVFFRVGGSILLIFNPTATAKGPAPDACLPVPAHGATGPGHYCFAVARGELDRWRAYLDGEGVAIEADFHWPNGARSIYIRDPAGNSVEFSDPALWAEG